MPQDATVEKPVWAEMRQSDQSHERLEKHAPANTDMMTKWEVINHLITAAGLIVLLQITLEMFISKAVLTQAGLVSSNFYIMGSIKLEFSKNIPEFKVKKWLPD